VQVKRIHEYKRQHLNVLHIVTLYSQLRTNPNLDITSPAPLSLVARRPRLPHGQADDQADHRRGGHGEQRPRRCGACCGWCFLPNYNVTNSQRIYPAADLSEQISTAGFEASGTGNMKFAMNGALTIGTLDGANVEIRDAVGPENFFLFGLTADQVVDLKAAATTLRLLPEQPAAERCHRPDCLGPFFPRRRRPVQAAFR
jgi:starch phosphorylase